MYASTPFRRIGQSVYTACSRKRSCCSRVSVWLLFLVVISSCPLESGLPASTSPTKRRISAATLNGLVVEKFPPSVSLTVTVVPSSIVVRACVVFQFPNEIISHSQACFSQPYNQTPVEEATRQSAHAASVNDATGRCVTNSFESDRSTEGVIS